MIMAAAARLTTNFVMVFAAGSVATGARALELPAARLESPLEGAERLRRRRHEPAKSLGEDLVHVLGAHVRVAAWDLVLRADGENFVDCRGDRRMIVLTGKTEILRQVALADQDHADAGHLLEHLWQVADRAD